MDNNIFQEKLEEWLKYSTNVVLAGIGNPIRKDDFVGTKIIQDLIGKVSKKNYLIACETIPESFTQEIINFDPTHVLLIDAALLGLKPGNFMLVNPNQLSMKPAFSSHMLPLRIFCDYLQKTINPKIALILIEPENTDFGEGLTPKIKETAENLEKILIKLLP